MAIVWNKVTWYSKLAAVLVLLVTIAIGHYFYLEFQKLKNIKAEPFVQFFPQKVPVLEKKTLGNGVAYYSNDEEKLKEINSLKETQYQQIIRGSITVNGFVWNTVESINIPMEGRGTAGSVFFAFFGKDNQSYIFECIDCNKEVFGDFADERRAVFDNTLASFKFTK